MQKYTKGPDLSPHMRYESVELFKKWKIHTRGVGFRTLPGESAGLWYATRANADNNVLSLVMIPDGEFPPDKSSFELAIDNAQFFFGAISKSRLMASDDPYDALIESAEYLCLGTDTNRSRLEFVASNIPYVIPTPAAVNPLIGRAVTEIKQSVLD